MKISQKPRVSIWISDPLAPAICQNIKFMFVNHIENVKALRAKHDHVIVQHEDEWMPFIAWAKQQSISSYLEIGSARGGTLLSFCEEVHVARAMSIDLSTTPGDFSILSNAVTHLRCVGVDCSLHIGKSQSKAAIAAAVSRGPFDLCFIDGAHDFKSVKADWFHYSKISRYVAFHDIVFEGGGVKDLWAELPGDKVEFIAEGSGFGIGVIDTATQIEPITEHSSDL